MLYNEFINYVKVRVEERVGDSVKIEVRSVEKNNSTVYDGLIFVSEGINISPTIYLNFFYKQYLDGTNIENIVNNIVKMYDSCVLKEGISLDFFTDFDFAKEHIVYKIINYERNKKLLEEIPHIKYLDLAIVFYYLINKSVNENATILIYNSHLDMWGTDLNTVYNHAKKNTPKLLPVIVCNIFDIIGNALEEMEVDTRGASPMYVVTNRSKINGAAVFLYDGFLREFSQKFKSNIYIIPSSINEVILVSDRYVSSKEELDKMVEEANACVVSKEEVLSDHVYLYSFMEDIII